MGFSSPLILRNLLIGAASSVAIRFLIGAPQTVRAVGERASYGDPAHVGR